jgi:hypothetical protein
MLREKAEIASAAPFGPVKPMLASARKSKMSIGQRLNPDIAPIMKRMVTGTTTAKAPKKICTLVNRFRSHSNFKGNDKFQRLRRHTNRVGLRH